MNRNQVAPALHRQHNAPSGHTGEQEPRGPRHRQGNTKHEVDTPVNRNQVAQDTAHTLQRTERAQWQRGAKWTRTPHTQHNTPSGHTGEEEPSGPGHRPRNKKHRAGRPLNRSQGAPGHRTRNKKHRAGTPLNRSQGAPGHRTGSTAHQAGTLVNGSQGAQDTAHTTQRTEPIHR